MKIRLKLTLQFVLITMIINLIAYATIYLLSADYRREEFYDRLYNKAVNTVKLLIDVSEIDSELLKIIDQNTTSLTNEKVVVLNFQNEEIYNNQDEPGNDYSEEILNKIRLNGELRFKDGIRECYGMLYAGEYDRYLVIAEAYDLYGIRKMNNLRLILIIVFIGSMLAILGGGWLFAGEALRPIKKIIDQLAFIDDANLHARVSSDNDRDEIAKLATEFNKMLRKLEEAFHMQKSFVAHASHELRTPLTSITGQIEVALLNKRSDDEYRHILRSVLEDIRGLTQLTNGLLTLAQTTRENLISNFRDIRIDETLMNAVEQLRKKSYQNEIIVDFDNEPEDFQQLTIRGDEQLLKSAFTNLLDNACKFSENKSVNATFNFTEDDIVLKISDRGIGIPLEDLPHVFAPLYRAQNARKYKGFGLGLSLTKKILDFHDADIQVNSSEKGTLIQVRFETTQKF